MLADDESERRALSKALLPPVRRFYTGYFDPEAHKPFYRPSARA
jgi:5-methylthioadenosine/S-adenosylhomocysteine deaminase